MRAPPLLCALVALASAVAAAGCAQESAPGADPAPPAPRPDVEQEAIRFETEIGPVTVLLYPDAAPATVAHMKRLVREGYYDGREFNRVVPGHVIQLVDKAGGATDDLRTVPLEVHPDHHFSAGAAGIARGADPNSGGPEFFLMDFATSHLDGNYTVWGQVVEGLGVVHRAARVEAVATGQVPGLNMVLADRTAVDAVAIVGASVVAHRMPAEEADRFPLRVAQNVRVGDWRHSLEWPRDLRPGGEAALSWYVRTYNNSSPPPAAAAAMHVDGATLPVTADPLASGAFGFRWTPGRPGIHEASLLVDGRPAATLTLTVG